MLVSSVADLRLPSTRHGRNGGTFTVPVQEHRWQPDRAVDYDTCRRQQRFSNVWINARAIYTDDADPKRAYHECLLRAAIVYTIPKADLLALVQAPKGDLQEALADLLSKQACRRNFVHVYIFPASVERPQDKPDSAIYWNTEYQ